ncbi:hypothetical protein PFISCL1PPCAC_29092, partial [Pristionchus fissidentatus]
AGGVSPQTGSIRTTDFTCSFGPEIGNQTDARNGQQRRDLRGYQGEQKSDRPDTPPTTTRGKTTPTAMLR